LNLADETDFGKRPLRVTSPLSVDQLLTRQGLALGKNFSSPIHFLPTRCEKATRSRQRVAKIHEHGLTQTE
jgi:hypothetical protein